MNFIIIIYLLFLSLLLVSGNPQVNVPKTGNPQVNVPKTGNPQVNVPKTGNPQVRTNAIQQPGPVKPNGSGHHTDINNPGRMFGWDRGLDATARDQKNHPYLLAQEFVAAHNWVRKRFNQPPYKWDEKLASYARQYAMQRYKDCNMVHSSGPYGENMFWGKKLHWTASDAVYYWYIENLWFNFNSLKCLAPKGKDCGHFTQIVWRDSVRIGCAIQNCSDTKGMLIVCEYDPPGNYVNENPLDLHVNAKIS